MACIVLDKSILQRSTAEELKNFSRKHSILIPETLVFEIVTDEIVTEESNRKRVGKETYFLKLRDCRERVRGCKSVGELIKEETKTIQPARSVVDREKTRFLLNALADPNYDWTAGLGAVPLAEYKRLEQETVEHRRTRQRRIIASSWPAAAKGVTQEARNNGIAVTKYMRNYMCKFIKDKWKEDFPFLPGLCTERSVSFMMNWLLNFIEFRRAVDGEGSSIASRDKVLFNETLDMH